MSLEQAVLWIHIGTGTVALILGPIAMGARKRRGTHTRVGKAYHWFVLAVCLAAAVLVAIDWQRRIVMLPIAMGSYGLALMGYLAARRKRGDWIARHIGGMGGSYIAMVTAVLIANWRSIAPLIGIKVPVIVLWLLPSIIGTPMIIWASMKAGSGKPRPS